MIRSAISIVLLVASFGCASKTSVPFHPRETAILSINDVYRIEGVEAAESGGLARVRTLRASLEERYPELLLLHAGDAIYPSDQSRLFGGAQMIDVLSRLDGDPREFDGRMLVTIGNHELDRKAPGDAAHLAELFSRSQFNWLRTNIEFADPFRGLFDLPNLREEVIVDSGRIRIGIFGVTTDVTHPAYIASFGSPRETAIRATESLRARGAEVVVALTHLDLEEDEQLLSLGTKGPDLVIGGHDHVAIESSINGRWILKADADARSAQLVVIREKSGGGFEITPKLMSLSGTDQDPAVRETVNGWKERFDSEWCRSVLSVEAGCLSRVVGKTNTELEGEEERIRRFETSLGNWLADIMRRRFGAQVAFLNSGLLRLNYDIPAGSEITRGQVEALFGFPAPTRLVRIDGATLERVISRSVEGWNGNGWWLQISGLAFAHDPRDGSVSDLTILEDGKARPLNPDEFITAVTVDYLMDPAGTQDGYTMLHPSQIVATGPDLKELALSELRSTRVNGGIAPRKEGRICNALEPGPCLAVPARP